MGIKDLLPSLKSIQKTQHISAYAGQTVAIDGYCWLHQGAYHCAYDLAQGNNRGLDKLIQYCKFKLDVVVSSGVKPIVVFDGNRLHMKQDIEVERQKNRENARVKAEQYEREGNSALASRFWVQSIDITPDIANSFITHLKSQQIEFYIAPYEADAQLAFLYMTGKAQSVITEDSDLLPFGCKNCFFKMDKTGNGVEIDLCNLSKVTDYDFTNFSGDKLLVLCILSGCDYLDSIKGIGFKKAYKLVYDHGEDVSAILRKIRREGKYMIPADYERSFERALLTFKFQVVYCPEKEELVNLNDPTEHPLGPLLLNYSSLDFLGEKIDKETAQQICQGDLDPITRQCYTLATNNGRQEMKVYSRGNISYERAKARKNMNISKNQGNLKNFFSQGTSNKTKSSQPSSNSIPEESTSSKNITPEQMTVIDAIKQKMKDRVRQDFKFKVQSSKQSQNNSQKSTDSNNKFTPPLNQPAFVDTPTEKINEEKDESEFIQQIIENDTTEHRNLIANGGQNSSQEEQNNTKKKRPLEEIVQQNTHLQQVNQKKKHRKVENYFQDSQSQPQQFEQEAEAPWAFNTDNFIKKNSNAANFQGVQDQNEDQAKIEKLCKVSIPRSVTNLNDSKEKFAKSYNIFMNLFDKKDDQEENTKENDYFKPASSNLASFGKNSKQKHQQFDNQYGNNKNLSKIQKIMNKKPLKMPTLKKLEKVNI